jgi:2-polyprenyl-3-methyl-5-hydroxy-6-metoxy-1,4-benzoquinol methylase
LGALAGQTNAAYGEGINFNLLKFMGPLSGVVIDLGCGTGGWASYLRNAGATRIKGLEPSDGGVLANERYDDVLRCSIEDAPAEFFSDASTVVMADVLEHLTDPWGVLRKIRQSVPDGATLAISVPNLQNIRLLLPIVISGDFEYSDLGGIRDRGHLRWFTQSSLAKSVTAADWKIERQGGYLHGRIANYSTRGTRGRAAPWFYKQLHLLGRAG